MALRITLKTADGWTIVGDHYRGANGSPAILLLHMMPATRASWKAFAEKLNAEGFGVLAIDLRGHGESDGGPDGYRAFTDEDHQRSIEDVRAAAAFQKTEGHSNFFVAGASIGASLALQPLAESEEVRAAILLSPGLAYRNIDALAAASYVREDQGVFIVAAKDDTRASGAADEQGTKIFDALQCRKEIKIFDRGGHGTTMFDAHPDLAGQLMGWLKKF